MAIMILTGLRLIFARPLLLLLTAGLAILAFVIAALLPNLGLTWQIASSREVSVADKVNVVASFIGSIGTGSSALSLAITATVAILFGANGAAVAFLLKQGTQRTLGATQATTSLAGLATGIAGMGCAACGTVAIGPVLSLLGIGSGLAFLPLGGQEFSILAIALLAGSLLLAARHASMASSCAIRAYSSSFQRPNETETALHGASSPISDHLARKPR
jgi:hypothetical protein